MKPKYVLLVALAIVCLAIGYTAGQWQAARQLAKCEARSEQFEQDLKTAIARGVNFETKLILCEENK